MTDHCDNAGAHALAARIKHFWHKKGHAVAVRVEHESGSKCGPIWVVRSNMLDGMPPEAVGHRSAA
jgi:hypothetical protein